MEKENTHIVIKKADALKYLTEVEYKTLEQLQNVIGRGRAEDGKRPINNYYVCNTDEEYASAVKDVILMGENGKHVEITEIGISVTKSGFYKVSPYREYVFGPPLEKWFEEVEKALGFKLFFWQKTFIAHGAFRCYGKTTAEILRDLSQTQHRPLDLRKYKTRPMRERIYFDELLSIKAALDAAGVPTREVWLCEKDRREWTKKWEEDHAPAEAARPQERFWEV